MASKTNLPSLIDMVLEYKPGRTNQVADALSRKAEPAAFKCEEVAATSWVTSTLPHRIRDGLEKDPREAFCTKLRNAKLGLDQGPGSWSQKGIDFSCLTFGELRKSLLKECHDTITTTGAGHPGTHRRPCWNGAIIGQG